MNTAPILIVVRPTAFQAIQILKKDEQRVVVQITEYR